MFIKNVCEQHITADILYNICLLMGFMLVLFTGNTTGMNRLKMFVMISWSVVDRLVPWGRRCILHFARTKTRGTQTHTRNINNQTELKKHFKIRHGWIVYARQYSL
jgi:hypothetical protein